MSSNHQVTGRFVMTRIEKYIERHIEQLALAKDDPE
jgi:hypothetical protein